MGIAMFFLIVGIMILIFAAGDAILHSIEKRKQDSTQFKKDSAFLRKKKR